MTPKPPSSSDGSPLSPRHRPVLGNLAHDTTEIDLWAFEDEIDGPDAGLSGPRGVADELRVPSRELPQPREKPKTRRDEVEKEQEHPSPKSQTGGEDSIRMNIHKPRVRNQSAGYTPAPAIEDSDFVDLDSWEDSRPFAEPELPPSQWQLESAEELEIQEAVREPIEEPVQEMPRPEVIEEAPSAQEAPGDPYDEFTPVRPANAVPISLRPHLGLTGLERLGLIILLALLAVTATFVLIASSKGIRTETVKASARDFPIQGAKLTVQSAVTYWRPPITEGPETDVFRRDTQLLPVVELDTSGGPATIRVLFRNDERTIVGDAVTREIHQAGLIKIAATAGFDDLGMHAAYRTGESKAWTIEVYEDTGSEDFRLLFEMNISTDRR